MKKKYHRIIHWCKYKVKTITPGKIAVKGAVIGLLSITILLWLIYSFLVAANSNDSWILLLFIGLTLSIIIASFLTLWLMKMIFKIPRSMKLALLISVPRL